MARLRGQGPYGKGRSLTGRAGVPYGSFTEKDDEEAYGKAGPLRKALTKRDGPFTEKDDEEAYGKAGPLREAPYEEERSLREGPEFREAYGKLWGETLPELGGNFRLCAVDQKKPFFPKVGPFLDLLPFKGPFSLTGALTGTALREGPLRGGFLREGRALTGSPLRGGTVLTGRAGVPYGSFTEKDDEEAYGKAKPLREAPYEKGRSLMEGPGSLTGPSHRLALTGRPTYGKASYGEASYRKAPYGEASYGKAPDGEVS